MNPILFALNNLLAAGDYIPGEFIYPQNVALTSAVVTCTPPATDAVVLTLEIGGLLTAIAVHIPPSGDAEFRAEVPVNITVPMNSAIRWKATAAPAILGEEGAATKLSITMEAVPGGDIAVLPLVVRWVNGAQRSDLYYFDQNLVTFQDISHGLSATTATIINPDDLGTLFEIDFGAVQALRVQAGSLHANALTGINGVTPPVSEGGFIEFMAGLVRVATLTASGILRVPSAIQGSLPPTPNTFVLKTGNTPTALLGLTGLTALGFQEPL